LPEERTWAAVSLGNAITWKLDIVFLPGRSGLKNQSAWNGAMSKSVSCAQIPARNQNK